MKKLQADNLEQGGRTGKATESIVYQPCPNALLCRRWIAADDGLYCRLCWRDFTQPRMISIAERRA